VFNKIDKLRDRSIIHEVTTQYKDSVFISAERGINISSLKEKLLQILDSGTVNYTLTIQQSDYRTIAKLYEIANIITKEYEDNSVKITFRINQKNMERLKKLLGKRGFDRTS
jgi:GTP-binding protein HflX